MMDRMGRRMCMPMSDRTLLRDGGSVYMTLSPRSGRTADLPISIISADITSTLQVTEETVLTDRAGLFLNSGPYMLIYSRCVPEVEINGETGEPLLPLQYIPPADMELSWPSDFLVSPHLPRP